MTSGFFQRAACLVFALALAGCGYAPEPPTPKAAALVGPTGDMGGTPGGVLSAEIGAGIWRHRAAGSTTPTPRLFFSTSPVAPRPLHALGL